MSTENPDKLWVPIAYRPVEYTPELGAFEAVASQNSVTPGGGEFRLSLLELGEMTSLRALGETAIEDVQEAVSAHRPKTFNRELDIAVTGLQVLSRGERNYVTLLTRDRTLWNERHQLLNVIRKTIGSLPPDFEHFRMLAIYGRIRSARTFRRNPNIKENLDRAAPRRLYLGVGEIE